MQNTSYFKQPDINIFYLVDICVVSFQQFKTKPRAAFIQLISDAFHRFKILLAHVLRYSKYFNNAQEMDNAL